MQLALILFSLDLFSLASRTFRPFYFPLNLTSVAGGHQRQACAFYSSGRPRLSSGPTSITEPTEPGGKVQLQGPHSQHGPPPLFDICTKKNSWANRASLQQFSSKCSVKTGQLFLRGILRGCIIFILLARRPRSNSLPRTREGGEG